MKSIGAIVLCLFGLTGLSRAAEINIATLSCVKYQNEITAPPVANPNSDSINTVMWLFGYAVGKSGAKVMYGDALTAFGFALDAECKNNPTESLLDAISTVKPDPKNPMDLTMLDCATFSARHLDLKRTDPDSAMTIMNWLFGFSVAKSGGHIFDAGAIVAFEPALMADCKKFPERNLYDALVSIKFGKAKN
ncbi:MAG TPA: HdeA/HdeB family chaperone [Steroidobacteraceae bacterium]